VSQHRCRRAFGSSVRQLPYARPEGTATPLSHSPLPHAHKPTLRLHLHIVQWQPSTSFASVSVTASSIPRAQVLTWAMLWSQCTPAPCPAHKLTHTLMLTLPVLRGMSTTAHPTLAAPGHHAGTHTCPVCCETLAVSRSFSLHVTAQRGGEQASSSPASAGQQPTCLRTGSLSPAALLSPARGELGQTQEIPRWSPTGRGPAAWLPRCSCQQGARQQSSLHHVTATACTRLCDAAQRGDGTGQEEAGGQASTHRPE